MFLTRRFYIALATVTLLIASGYWWAPLFTAGQVALALFVLLVAADIVLLYMKRAITAERHMPDRFSNGDWNKVRIDIHSSYPFRPRLTVINEAPAFEDERLKIKDERALTTSPLSPCRGVGGEAFYRPVRRGVYNFGHIRIFARSPISFVERRYTCGEPQDVKVYPSYLMLRQYELLAISHRLTDLGIKKIRRIGHDTEFEQIRDYVQGDDFRTINWRATARRSQLMVNVYQDERSQQIFSVIDKGRVMQQAFRGMTLLDYAINASLVLSYVAMHREDKAGLMTFSTNLDTYIPAQRNPAQMQTILESLYGQQTDFGETDYSALVDHIRQHVSKRSLLIIYTNFSNTVAMQRQLPYLQQLARHHRVLVVFFLDAELQQYAETTAATTEDYYRHVVAEKALYEQRLIVSQLRRHGILSLLTTPDELSVDVINKYLELKARQMVT